MTERHPPPLTLFWLPFSGFWLRLFFWLLASGFWLLVSGFSFLACLLAVILQRFAVNSA
jgi:membrane protein implicated in regulation of membrane protease activity